MKNIHHLADVTQHHGLGYDLECQGHCSKVFEIKGMGEPNDVILEKSEVNAANQKLDDYILICVYNLPADLEKIGYKEIPNPTSIFKPIEKARVTKSDWLSFTKK